MAELTWAEMSVNLDRQKELIKAVLPVAPDGKFFIKNIFKNVI